LITRQVGYSFRLSIAILNVKYGAGLLDLGGTTLSLTPGTTTANLTFKPNREIDGTLTNIVTTAHLHHDLDPSPVPAKWFQNNSKGDREPTDIPEMHVSLSNLLITCYFGKSAIESVNGDLAITFPEGGHVMIESRIAATQPTENDVLRVVIGIDRTSQIK
jgi:hypothetical protein